MNNANVMQRILEMADAQLGQVQTVGFAVLPVGAQQNPVVAFAFLAGLILVLALACRHLLYAAVRLSGRTQLRYGTETGDNVCLWVAFALGVAAGEVVFRNLLLAALSGGVFFFACTGATLEALVANEAARRSARTP